MTRTEVAALAAAYLVVVASTMLWPDLWRLTTMAATGVWLAHVVMATRNSPPTG